MEPKQKNNLEIMTPKRMSARCLAAYKENPANPAMSDEKTNWILKFGMPTRADGDVDKVKDYVVR